MILYDLCFVLHVVLAFAVPLAILASDIFMTKKAYNQPMEPGKEKWEEEQKEEEEEEMEEEVGEEEEDSGSSTS